MTVGAVTRRRKTPPVRAGGPISSGGHTGSRCREPVWRESDAELMRGTPMIATYVRSSKPGISSS
jgi:hypothetical protein